MTSQRDKRIADVREAAVAILSLTYDIERVAERSIEEERLWWRVASHARMIERRGSRAHRELADGRPLELAELEDLARELGVSDDVAREPIVELELGVRSYNTLKRADISTIGELASKTREQLCALPGFGKHSLDEVVQALAQRSLHLRHRDRSVSPESRGSTLGGSEDRASPLAS